MSDRAFTECPSCGAPLHAGFAGKTAGLSFVSPEKFTHYAFLDEDLSNSGTTKLIPWKAEYFRSYLCRSCELYLVDYHTVLDRHQAEELARSLVPSGENE
jgi:hypothetical protein